MRKERYIAMNFFLYKIDTYVIFLSVFRHNFLKYFFSSKKIIVILFFNPTFNI